MVSRQMFFVGMISKSAPPSEFILSTLDLPPYISLRATGKAHTELASPLSRTYFHVSGMTAGPNKSVVCQCLELVRRHGLCPCVRFRGRVRLQWDALRLGAAIDCFPCLRVCPAPTCASPSHTQGCHLPARALPMPPAFYLHVFARPLLRAFHIQTLRACPLALLCPPSSAQCAWVYII